MKTARIIAFILVMAICIPLVAACSSTPTEEERVIREPEYISLFADGASDYKIIRPETATELEKSAAMALRNAFTDKFSASPSLTTDWIMRGESVPEDALEILVGNTNRDETAIVKNSIDGEMYAVAVINSKVVICATSDEYLADAVKYFADTFINTAADTVLIEKTTNEVAVRNDDSWLMARTLAIEVEAANVVSVADSKATIEIISAIDADDYSDVGFTVELTTVNGTDTVTFNDVRAKGETYTSGGATYNAADYNKGKILAVELTDIDAASLTKINIVPYIVKFDNTYYGLSSFACQINGDCETISTIEVKDGVYQLSNAAEMHVFGNYVNNGHRALNAELTADIDLAGISWTPIGTSGISYKGSFNGNGHTLSGLYVNVADAACAGFFGCIGSSSEIKDITFSDAYIVANNNANAGIIAGENRGLITGCTASGNISTSDRDGKATAAYAKENTMLGVGGLVGTLNGKYKSSVEKSEFKGKIDVSGNNVTFVGGIAGRSVAISGDITGCVNSGEVNVSSDINNSSDKTVYGVGGIIGSVMNAEICDSVNKGTVSLTGKVIGIGGGIAGNVLGMGQIVDCRNEGTVKSSCAGSAFTKGYIGGIVGTFSEKTITDGIVLRCYNKGEISGDEATYTGGIVGTIGECRAYIFYSYNVGKVSSAKYAGGIAGQASSNKSFIMNCYNAGEVKGETTGGIIGNASSSFKTSYTTAYFKEDKYLTYNNNSYLSTVTENASGGSTIITEGGAADKTALAASVLELAKTAPNNVEAHEFYIADAGNVNGGLPIFEYQTDSSKIDAEVPIDLYRNHSVNIEPDGSLYYMANRYTDYMEDGGIQISVAEFESKMDEKSETAHNIIDENGNVTGTCYCTAFGADHCFTISKWKMILEDVNNNLQGVADWANRGEIRWIGHLIADTDQSSGSVAVTWRLINDSTTLSINFNVTYYKNERCDGATVHEMAHSQLLDGPCESWVAEGDADYVKYNYYVQDNKDLVNYKWKADDLKGAYTPTASCLTWLSYQYGYKAARIALTFDTVLTGGAEKGWVLGFGAEYEDIWDLFGQAGKYDKIAYFHD